VVNETMKMTRKILPRFVVSRFPFLVKLGINVFRCQTQRP